MKKQILLLFMLCCCIFVANAQPNLVNRKPHRSVNIKDNGEGKRVNFGFSFAPTIDWMIPKTEGLVRNGAIMGMRGGLNINVNLTQKKNYYVSTGVFFEQNGGKLAFIENIPLPFDSLVVNSTPTQRTYRANYITIPLGITLKTRSLNNFFITGNVGLYNSFLLKAFNEDAYSFKNDRTGEAELWSKQKTVSNETSICKETVFAGVGFEYSITKDFRAGLTVNYAHSLSNYFKGRQLAPNNYSKLDQKAKIGYVEIVLNINFL